MTEHTPESLRERLKADGVPHTGEQDYYWQVAEDAIDAAEHYRACASSWCRNYDSMLKHARELEAENQRLREALERIAGNMPGDALATTHRRKNIARDALDGYDPEDGDAP